MTELNNLIPAEKEAAIKKNIVETQSTVDTIVVNDDASLHLAGEILGKIKVNLKRLEELKKELTKPFADAVKNANNWFKTQAEPFERMESMLKQKMGAFMAEVQRKAEEEAKAAAELAKKEAAKAAKKGEPVVTPPPLPVVRPSASVQTTTGKAIATKVWKYEITDESKLPREYLQPDPGAIQKAVREGAREIAGCRIFEDTQVSFRS